MKTIEQRIYEYFDQGLQIGHLKDNPPFTYNPVVGEGFSLCIDGRLDCGQLAAHILGSPEEQAKHALATIIALLRLVPIDDRFEAMRLIIADLHEGVFR